MQTQTKDMNRTQNALKILHTADWHLGAPMETHLPPEKARQRRAELCSRFADMVTYAKENAVSAVLLCGDLSDAPSLPMTEAEYLLSLMRDAAPIRFFYAAGNHDTQCFSASRIPYPENLTVFGSEWESAALADDVTVTGRILPADMEDNAMLPAFAASGYHIVMVHGQLTDGKGFGGPEERIAIPDFRNKNIDYLALGHIHQFQHGRLDTRCTWCYPGCPEGRGFDECGEKGFVVLTIADGVCRNAEFVKFSTRQLHVIPFDVTDLPLDLHARETALFEKVGNIPAEDYVKVQICGTDRPDAILDLCYLEKRLGERFFSAVVQDQRRMELSEADYKMDISLKGEFYRHVMASALQDSLKEDILRCGFAALRGESDRKEGGR